MRNLRCWSTPLGVSSHVIQVRHGVAPPAQLKVVPLRLTQLVTSSARGVISRVVVPPGAEIGVDPDLDAKRGFMVEDGLTVLGKGQKFPDA